MLLQHGFHHKVGYIRVRYVVGPALPFCIGEDSGDHIETGLSCRW